MELKEVKRTVQNYFTHYYYEVDGELEPRLTICRDHGTNTYSIRHIKSAKELFKDMLTTQALAETALAIVIKLLALYQGRRVGDFYDAVQALGEYLYKHSTHDCFSTMMMQLNSIQDIFFCANSITFTMEDKSFYTWDILNKQLSFHEWVRLDDMLKKEVRVGEDVFYRGTWEPATDEKKEVTWAYSCDKKEDEIWIDNTGDTPKEINMTKLEEVDRWVRITQYLDNINSDVNTSITKLKALNTIFEDIDGYELLLDVLEQVSNRLNDVLETTEKLKEKVR